MPKLTDIKYRIDQLDGGAFQNLCDAYLCCRGYGSGYSLGMNTGTDKTAKGNPDTYFLTTNNKYVFVMYTTQKTDFFNKTLEDIQKCFNQEKTGVLPEDVVEIVYCHTYGRLSPGEHQSLCKFCEDRKSKLTLIGLDELGNDLFLKYPRLAKDYLGIEVDTGQITSLKDFVIVHDANKMTAPLDTEFMFREEEIKATKQRLNSGNTLIISGPAGVGKTRFALQLCEEYANEHRLEILCIKSNGLELYEDLASWIERDKNYLIFVDDANELSGLHFVLDYLPKTVLGRNSIQKVIMTVRDYARQQVVNHVLDYEKPEIVKLGILKDEDIRKLMETSYGITNHLYLDRIIAIAEGNARLAMLAGKVAADANEFDSIRDASELYKSYFGKQIREITASETGIVSAGIISFFQTLNLDHLQPLEPIFEATKITEERFISDLKELHDMELVDLCHDKAARISDQSFSNYLIKYTLIDRKVISLSQMIEICFYINRERTISACNILLNVFSDAAVQTYIEQQINIVWDKLQNDEERFPPFFRAFYMIRPTETLLLLKEKIDKEPVHPFDVKSIEFKKNDGGVTIDDDVVEVLCGFKYHEQLPAAVELLLRYYQKRPDLFKQIFSACVIRWGIDKDSYHFGYYTQKVVVEGLCKLIENNPCDGNLLLFVRVAEQLLKLCFSHTEGGRRNTVTFYTIPLTLSAAAQEYRKNLLEHLFGIYQSGKCRREIESLLMDYCKPGGYEIDYDIIKLENREIFQFVTQFSTDNLYHCVIAEHIEDVLKHTNMDNCGELSRFFDSPKYKMYYILKQNRREMFGAGYREGQVLHRERVQKFVHDFDVSRFQELFQVCIEWQSMLADEREDLSSGIEYAIDAASGNRELYINVVKAYLDADTPCDIRPTDIIQKLFEMISADDVKTLITSCAFSQQNKWLWEFYVALPVDQITIEWALELLDFLQSPPKSIQRSPLRPLDDIAKYKCVDKDIIIKASRIVASHFTESPFVFSLYFTLLFNPCRVKAKDIVKQYEKDLNLLADIYLKITFYSSHEDYDGEFLAEIVRKNPDFLYRYLKFGMEQANDYRRDHDAWVTRLEFIWKEDSYIFYADQILTYLLKDDGLRPWIFSSILDHVLRPHEGRSKDTQRQDDWIQHVIENGYSDKRCMCILFEAISDHSCERRRTAIRIFLEHNIDFELFDSLYLEASGWGGVGSMIPYMQARITYLNSLLPLLSGLDFLKHKKKVEHSIEIWKCRIKEEEVRELLESFAY